MHRPTPTAAWALGLALGLGLGGAPGARAQANAAEAGAGAHAHANAAHEALRQQVAATERAFAKTLADRDLAAFTRYLSAETVWRGGAGPLVGPEAVVAAWKRFFEGPTPPFSWAPDQVEVMANGQLAISTGPVRDPAGQVVNRFHSVWRQEAPGVWRIVLDMGTPACDCARP